MSFDAAALHYDETFGRSPAGRLFRFRLAERVCLLAPPPLRVLDVGCGTGDDALWLAGGGYSVTGIDASLNMIERAKQKNAGSAFQADFIHTTLENFSTDQAFDVVISDFGALNCVPLGTSSRTLAKLLGSGGRAVLSLMGRHPLPEWFRNPVASAKRREAGSSSGSTDRQVWYPGLGEILLALRPFFRVGGVEALGCVVPGPQYEAFARRNPLAFGFLASVEAFVRRVPVVRGLGDHTLIEAVRL